MFGKTGFLFSCISYVKMSFMGGNVQKSPHTYKTNKMLIKNKPLLQKTTRKPSTFNIDNVPHEIWMEILKYMDLGTIFIFPQVCRKWRDLVDNELLWKGLFEKYANISPFTFKVGLPTSSQQTGSNFWKAKCLKYFILQRNKFYKSKIKKNLYTGTTSNLDQHLKNMGVRFLLCVETLKGGKHFVRPSYKKVFNSSTILHWSSLDKFPDWKEFKSISIFGLVPVLFQGVNKPLKSSPKQKSLLLKSEVTNHIKISYPDKKVDILQVDVNTSVALWKGTSDVAFVLTSIHHHNHVAKLLYGNEEQMHVIKHNPVPDDIDPKYGLHSYECHIHFHSMNETIWDEKFTCMECEVRGNFAEFQIPKFTSLCENVPKIAWKTDLFNGTLDNAAFVAVTLVDSNKEVVWENAGIVFAKIATQSEVDFLNSHDEYVFHISDGIGYITLTYKVVDSECNIKSINMGLAVAHIINWFGKNYET